MARQNEETQEQLYSLQRFSSNLQKRVKEFLFNTLAEYIIFIPKNPKQYCSTPVIILLCLFLNICLSFMTLRSISTLSAQLSWTVMFLTL